MRSALREAIAELDELKTRFDARSAPRKAHRLRQLAAAAVEDPEDLIAYHEALCFLRAFPDDGAILSRSESELRRFGRRVRACRRVHGGELPEPLVDSGIAGTSYHYPFGLPMARWLVTRFGESVDVDWEEIESEGSAGLEGLLPGLVGWVETDAVDDELLGVREWFERARGRRRTRFLSWLIARLDAHGLPASVAESIYNGLEVPIRWELGESPASRTLARGPAHSPYFHRGALMGRTRDLRGEIARPMRRLDPVPRARARRWIDLARCALSVRERELYPVALAHEGEVYEMAIGRGIRLLLLGTDPARRLPIEADYGALVVKNSVPIGYGVGAVLLDQAEIALNIFPTFRQGESSFVFEQLARLFRHQFSVRRLLIERYQLGHENDEGLDAGSFWFYYKLGFRPVDPRVRAMAEREAARLARRPGARSSRAMLRRLAQSNVRLDLREAREPPLPPIDLTTLSLRVSRFIEERFGGDRAAAEAACAARAASALGARDRSLWSESERRLFLRMSPVLALIPGIARWGGEEKALLVRVVRAKGGEVEADYVRELLNHPRLLRGLLALARRGAREGSARRGGRAPR